MEEPDTLEVGGETVCRLHHTPLVFDPAWAFVVTVRYPGMGRNGRRFPNAKWGHPATPEMAGHELVGLWHCPACEADRQQWLAEQQAKTGSGRQTKCCDRPVRHDGFSKHQAPRHRPGE